MTAANYRCLPTAARLKAPTDSQEAARALIQLKSRAQKLIGRNANVTHNKTWNNINSAQTEWPIEIAFAAVIQQKQVRDEALSKKPTMMVLKKIQKKPIKLKKHNTLNG